LALIVQAVWTCLLALSGTYNDLLNYIIFAAVLFYMVTVIGLLICASNGPTYHAP